MKKSTIGIVLLVAMVLTKAFLIDNEGSENPFARSEAIVSNLSETNDLRAQHQDELNVEPKANLLAANFESPVLQTLVRTESNEVKPVTVDPEAVLFASVDVNKQIDEELEQEIMPMDFVSNTGYGLWRNNGENAHSNPESEGKVPLDGGNTISDNISKLFPRTP